MLNIVKATISQIYNWLNGKVTETPYCDDQFSESNKQFLMNTVAFYQALNLDDQLTFRKRVTLFLSTTEIVGNGVEIEDEDRLLVAASAIIPVWAFTDWHYFNLRTVILVPAAFNTIAQVGQHDSNATGMVGTGVFEGKMILSKPALHHGFINSRDKKNVGIHEFAHLIDMSDGNCDGFPERLSEFSFSIPWLEFVREKIIEIEKRKSNIDAYGATNTSEFFAVATEYFFERPGLMKNKHPKLYHALNDFYKHDIENIKQKK